MTQDGLFDDVSARALRDEGIRRADENVDAAWRRVAYEAVVDIAHRRSRFTTDAPTALLDQRGIGQPREPRAWAGVMGRIKQERIAVLTADYMPSANKRSHGRPKRVWRSLVHSE